MYILQKYNLTKVKSCESDGVVIIKLFLINYDHCIFVNHTYQKTFSRARDFKQWYEELGNNKNCSLRFHCLLNNSIYLQF